MPVSSTKLKLKVVPGASSSGVSGWLGDALKIRVTAVPEKGKANKEAIYLLSEALSVPRDSLLLVSGESSPLKSVEVTGLSLCQIKQLIAGLVR